MGLHKYSKSVSSNGIKTNTTPFTEYKFKDPNGNKFEIIRSFLFDNFSDKDIFISLNQEYDKESNEGTKHLVFANSSISFEDIQIYSLTIHDVCDFMYTGMF